MTDIIGSGIDIHLNNVLIPGRLLEKTLASFTQPLAVWNHQDIYSLSLIGSSIGIHYRDRYLLLCTRHQLLNTLDGRPFEDVCLLDEDGKNVTTSGGIAMYDHKFNDSDIHDIVVYDYTEPCRDRPDSRKRFFNFFGPPPDIRSDHILGLSVTGFPSKKQKYNISEEERHIGFVRASVTCLPCNYNEQPPDEALLRLKSQDKLSFDPDGMSGGGAFVIQLLNGKPQAFFAGMTARAGENDIYIIKAGYIFKFINTIIDAKERAIDRLPK